MITSLIIFASKKMMSVGHVLDHVLDHVPDHVSDHGYDHRSRGHGVTNWKNVNLKVILEFILKQLLDDNSKDV